MAHQLPYAPMGVSSHERSESSTAQRYFLISSEFQGSIHYESHPCMQSPDYYAAAGADPRGRMIEMVGVELEDSRLLIFHAMRLTTKMADELCIGKENR